MHPNICMSFFLYIFAARNERIPVGYVIPNLIWDIKCGEIWLLATTLKNAKMLNMVINMMIRFHINVLCFCDGSAFLWGFCFCA